MRKLISGGLVLALAACGAHGPSGKASTAPERVGATGTQSQAGAVYHFDFSKYPADIRPKLLAEAAERVACDSSLHDGPQTIAACDRLVAIHKELEAKGWCRGPDAVQPSNRDWMRCGPEATPES
jgi:hypothetical protein